MRMSGTQDEEMFQELIFEASLFLRTKRPQKYCDLTGLILINIKDHNV